MPEALYPQEALDAAAAEVAWRVHGSRAADPDDILWASRILTAAALATGADVRGKRIIMARCEWHEECNGPICQVCDNCVCEGGCTCPDGATYGRQAAEALGYITPAGAADLLRAGPGLAHTAGDPA